MLEAFSKDTRARSNDTAPWVVPHTTGAGSSRQSSSLTLRLLPGFESLLPLARTKPTYLRLRDFWKRDHATPEEPDGLGATLRAVYVGEPNWPAIHPRPSHGREFPRCRECPPPLRHPSPIIVLAQKMVINTARTTGCRYERGQHALWRLSGCPSPIVPNDSAFRKKNVSFSSSSYFSRARHPASSDRLRSLPSGRTHGQDPLQARGRSCATKSSAPRQHLATDRGSKTPPGGSSP